MVQQAGIGGALPSEFKVPRKMRLMSRHIHDVLKSNPSCTSIDLDVEPYFLNIIIGYCQLYDYLKVMSTIMFPAAHNELQYNVTILELQAIDAIQHDLESLKKLLHYCKYLNIEALYELTACAIACYFKMRSYSHFSQMFPNNRGAYLSQEHTERQEAMF